MEIKTWKIIDSKNIINDKWMTLRADICETSNGVRIEPYYVQEGRDWVHIVAFNDKFEVLITEQYRHGIQKICLELPCGIVEDKEEPETAIQRELLEETGCKVNELIKLPPISPNPARNSNLIFPFVGIGVENIAKQNLDVNEEINFTFLPISKIIETIRNGEFWQSLHVSTFYQALDKVGLLAYNQL